MSKTDELLAAIAESAKGYQTRTHHDQFFPRVTSPGKFEGEPTWVIYLWSQALEGCADREVYEGDTLLSCFHIDRPFSLITGLRLGAYVCLWESEQGFVNWQVLHTTELDALEASEALESDPE